MTRRNKPTKLDISLLVSTEDNMDRLQVPNGKGVKGVQLLVVFLFVPLMAITFLLQFTSGVASAYVAGASISVNEVIPAPRGIFYDRNGKKLVGNEVTYNLFLSPGAEVTEELATILGKSVGDFDPEGRTLLFGVENAEYIVLRSKLEGFPVHWEGTYTRRYPHADLYSQVIGYTGIVSPREIEAGYSYGDRIGKYRLENFLEESLKGIKGVSGGSGANHYSFQSVPGHDVFLTVDHTWQRSLAKILGTQVKAVGGSAGAAAIIDTSNGDVMAYVSYPSFDANVLERGIEEEEYAKLLANRSLPLVDKVIGLQASPGSTFKVVSAFAGLSNGTINSQTRHTSNRCMKLGSYDFCELGKIYLGNLDVTAALQRSSNVFFCKASLELAAKEGFEAFTKAANLLGIGERTGILFEGELSGIMPSPAYKKGVFKEGWFPGDTCNAAIGQGMVTVTPLQMAMMVATLANGGKYYRPNLIDRISDAYGNNIPNSYRKLIREVAASDEARKLILEGMRKAAQEPGGSGYRFLHDVPLNFRVKTGSAEAFEVVNDKVEERVHSWIVGTFDYKDKTFAFVAHIHFGGRSVNVTPVMRDFGECLVNNFKNSRCQ